MTSDIEREVARRRTFAIISHPDAGKTTLTEKLLLYGGAIHLAGSVKARRARRHATSDWMELEKERGISVTSLGAPVRLPRPRGQPARHARPPGLLRGHLPDALRRRQRGDAHRRRQGRRAPDQEALPGLPDARHPHLHLRQQARPLRARPARPHGRARAGARHPRLPDELAHRHGSRVPRRLRPRRAGGARLLRRRGHPRRGRGRRAQRPARLARHRPGARRLPSWPSCARTWSCSTSAATPSTARRATRGSSSPMFFGSRDDQLRRAPVPRRLSRPRARAHAAQAPTAAPADRRPAASRASSSRSRRTWTRRTATASPSSGWCRAGTSRA